jgi:hypothetical protein
MNASYLTSSKEEGMHDKVKFHLSLETLKLIVKLRSVLQFLTLFYKLVYQSPQQLWYAQP